ncbi:hypothetical protein Acr_12g0004180 [Actinidia rufa]|uniref:Retrotransposon gag domain-containing protein n=1 Tax=Actinidia rufa TaxID=165716 RepID=A0A7J0FIZ0_9ERIC|nr:hypothetical protein Acr_12g0004180 [Actinidia rufa]
MHLRSRYLPRPSASSPLDNRAPPMANTSQVPDFGRSPSRNTWHGRTNEGHEREQRPPYNSSLLLPTLNLNQHHPFPGIERSRHSSPFERSLEQSWYRTSHGWGDAEHKVHPYTRVPRRNLVRHQQKARRREGGGVLIETIGSRHENKSTSQKFRDLDARLDAINTRTSAPVIVDTLIKQTEPLFTERILRARISSKFKLPAQLGIYERKTDPMDHLDSYKSLMSLQGCSDEIMCKAFSATLKGPVRNASHLFTIHQKETESLKDFVKRFNQAILEVEDPSDKVIIMAMMEGLRPGPLFDSLSKIFLKPYPPSRAKTYIAAEELAEAKRGRRGKDDHKRKEPETRRVEYREEVNKRPYRGFKRPGLRRPHTPPRRPEFTPPPLNAPIAQVLSDIKHEEFVKWLGKIKTDP